MQNFYYRRINNIEFFIMLSTLKLLVRKPNYYKKWNRI